MDVDVDVETTDREIDSSTHLRIKCERSNFTTLYSKFPLVAGICSDTGMDNLGLDRTETDRDRPI